MFDLIIRNGVLVDGSGKGRRHADVGVRGQFVEQVGDLGSAQARAVIDAARRVVAPGFVDFHSHADLYLLACPDAPEKVSQGVTTEVVGNCGLAAIPLSADRKDLLATYVAPCLGAWRPEYEWRDAADFFLRLEQARPAVNVATYVGHGSLRIAAMGFESRSPTPEEMSLMVRRLEASLDEGAVGLTSGLIYPPGCYAGFDELALLCKAVGARNKLYACHVRNESDRVVESVEDLISLGMASGCKVHLSHHKISGAGNWGKSAQTLALLDSSRARECGVTCDQYPYPAGSSTAAVLIPQWAVEGGIQAMLSRLASNEVRDRIRMDYEQGIEGWDCLVRQNGWGNITLNWVARDDDHRLVGHSFAEIGEMLGCDPAIALFDLLLRQSGEASIVIFQQAEEDIRRIMRHESTVFGSDALHAAARPHPRLWGTFPRVLGRYVRQEGVLTLEEAVHKMTGKPAALLGLPRMGLVRKGYYADLVVFDADRIEDRATFDSPRVPPVGISHVIVSGRCVVEDGTRTTDRPGRVIRV